MDSKSIEIMKLNLLGLYFTSPDCKYDECVYAFSFSKINLENMIENIKPEIEKKYYSIKPITLYKSFSTIKNQTFLQEINDINLLCKNNIYGYNKIEKIH